MKKSMTVFLAFLFIMVMAVTGAAAATYHDLFPSDPGLVLEGGLSQVLVQPTYGLIGGFDAVGEKVSQTFTNTGLASVNGLLLDVAVVDDFNYQLNFNVTVNGTYVGQWVHLAIDGAGPKSIPFVFEDIVGNGTYTITLEVAATNAPANLTPPDWFSIAYYILPYPGFSPLLLAGAPPCPCPPSAPIPGAVWLLGSGLVGLLGLRRKPLG